MANSSYLSFINKRKQSWRNIAKHVRIFIDRSSLDNCKVLPLRSAYSWISTMPRRVKVYSQKLNILNNNDLQQFLVFILLHARASLGSWLIWSVGSLNDLPVLHHLDNIYCIVRSCIKTQRFESFPYKKLKKCGINVSHYVVVTNRCHNVSNAFI